MESFELKEIARKFYECYNSKDLAQGFTDYISPDLVNRSLGGAYSRQDWLTTDVALLQACPDYSMTIIDQIAEGNKVVSDIIFQGTHTADFMHFPASGNKIYWQVVAIDKVEDGLIVEHLGMADFSQFFMQFMAKQ
jgi:predicted ester cyclase